MGTASGRERETSTRSYERRSNTNAVSQRLGGTVGKWERGGGGGQITGKKYRYKGPPQRPPPGKEERNATFKNTGAR